jgi:hypothetical protein
MVICKIKHFKEKHIFVTEIGPSGFTTKFLENMPILSVLISSLGFRASIKLQNIKVIITK